MRCYPCDRVFEVHATDGAARAGVLRTARGEIRTPVLCRRDEGNGEDAAPGRSARPRCADACSGTPTPLLRPGDEFDPRPRRLASIYGVDAADPHDSGGSKLLVARHDRQGDDEGVNVQQRLRRFRARFTPELSAQIQANLGRRHRDVPRRCRQRICSRRKLEDAVRRTTEWARRQRHAPRADGQLRFRHLAGRRRTRSCASARTEEIVELDFDGNALGGLAIGEDAR